jgi:hypothetical protein
VEINLNIHATVWGDDFPIATIRAMDLCLGFDTIEHFVGWLERHLKGGVPAGALDLARVRREGDEIFARHRREKEAESGRSAGRRRGLKQHKPER